jgi:hypothetical protein
LRALGAAAVGGPAFFDLLCLYVTGLILLDKRQNATRITRFLPGRCHDALNRLLRVMFVSTRVVMALLVALAQSYGLAGYLCLDDVVEAQGLRSAHRRVVMVSGASEDSGGFSPVAA